MAGALIDPLPVLYHSSSSPLYEGAVKEWGAEAVPFRLEVGARRMRVCWTAAMRLFPAIQQTSNVPESGRFRLRSWRQRCEPDPSGSSIFIAFPIGAWFE
ncbi:hypothetical protein [Mesorhizobium sp. BR1-1-14]|uniref:hypothetical protein n=1 Tax=Mesorhizobium sp. BR1-1-14 TaxID=2876655 RepID=UPI001CD12DE4|nr:hypothetical protein [Mesorhizobium sp. BR1-1-14]MBZ9961367.1 hypothetical protein [Mesorhizobium sp. BR1-1-14]